MSTNVKIPEKHYVGLVKRRDDKLPLGFMTPWGEDKAARDRMATVDRWARGSKQLEPMVINNEPLSGFRLTKSIRTTNYGGHDHWRVEDPRGFELEITSGNLAQLLSIGTLDRGDILDECVWARYGKDNVLLSTATEEYRAAVENTRVAGLKSSWRDARPGDRIVLQNNLRGIWLGKMNYVQKVYSYERDSGLGDDEIAVPNKAYHFILCDSSSQNYQQELHVISNPKLSYIESSEPVTPAEAEVLVNKYLVDRKVHKIISGYGNKPLIASFDNLAKGKNLTIDLVELDAGDVDDILHQINLYDGDTILARTKAGDLGIIKNISNNQNYTLYKISEPHLAQHELRRIQTLSKFRSSYFGNNQSSFEEMRIECPLDQVTEFYRLQLRITSSTGNTLTFFLR
jgi:hypothetical protein